MKTAVLTALMLACMTVPVFAQDASALCKLLRTESATAGAAYQSGVDVNGHPVIPADLSSSMPSLMPDVVKIPLTIDLAKRLNTPPPAGTEMEAKMATIEIRKDGSVTWNGQDLTPQARASCGMATAVPIEQPEPPVVPKVEPPLPPEPEHAVVTPYRPETKADWQSAIKPDRKPEPGSVLSSPEASTDLNEPAQEPAPVSSSIVKQEPDQPEDKNVIWGQGN